MRLIWSLCFRIRCHATHSRHQHGLGISFQREYFLCAGLRFVSTQQLGFSSLPPLRHVADGANAQSVAVRYSPLLILRFTIGFDPCADSVFALLNHLRRFTTLHLLCWLRHQRAFRAVSAFCYYYAARLSELFGSPLIRAFRQSVDPSFSAVR